MQTLRRLIYALLAVVTPIVLTSTVLAAEPGIPFPTTSEVSDQKLGSVLIFKAFTSSAASPDLANTQFSIVNSSQTSPVFLHLFLIDGRDCSVADTFICLTPCEIVCFFASDIDPGTTGYAVAVAVDSSGCPVSHNFLTGSCRVRFPAVGGVVREADLGAEAFARIVALECDPTSPTAVIAFDGVSYNRAARVLLAEPLLSTADASQLLIVDRVGGNLVTGVANIGPLFGIICDDAENKFSTTFTAGCQFVGDPRDFRTVPPIHSFLTTGRCAFLDFWATSDVGLVGALFTTYTSGPLTRFSSGKNLVKSTLTSSAFFIIPVIPVSC
jgi:hypothetical protein